MLRRQGMPCLSLWICEPCQERCVCAAGSRAMSCQQSLTMLGQHHNQSFPFLRISRLNQLPGEPSMTVDYKDLAYMSNRAVTLTVCSSRLTFFTLNFLSRCIQTHTEDYRTCQFTDDTMYAYFNASSLILMQPWIPCVSRSHSRRLYCCTSLASLRGTPHSDLKYD